MVGVLKVENLGLSVTPGEIRKFFKDFDARPDDIHLVLDKAGRHTGEAFVIYLNPQTAESGVRCHGRMLRDKRIIIQLSTPRDFNAHFPGVSMISKNNPKKGGRGASRGGISRGGFGRGSLNHISDFGSPPSFRDDRPPPFRGGHGSFRGFSAAGRGGGRVASNIADRSGRDSSFSSPRGSSSSRRDRSRSPVGKDARASFLRNFSDKPSSSPRNSHRDRSPHRDRDHSRDRRRAERERPAPQPPHAPASAPTLALSNINERKFVLISGLPFSISEVDIQDIFRPVLTREIFQCSNQSGKFAGRPNGEAYVEFFSENDARQALKMDGKRFMDKRLRIVRPRKEEILPALQAATAASRTAPAPVLPPDLGLDPTTASNPQVQQLLTLLTATVTSIAAASAAANKPPEPPRPDSRSERRLPPAEPDRDQSVISRVATSANIDVNDISAGRVVGIRNLPFTVTPEEILDFFRGYHAVPDSVRIHYLEDGRCSGDAIISFRSNRDARDAVGALNKKSIGRRKVDLFFL